MHDEANVLSIHCAERIKKRQKIKNEDSILKKAELAISRGKIAEDFSSRERSYLENKTSQDAIAVAYDGFCYIFSFNGVCITTFKLPNWFEKPKHYDGKVKIRNYKKYCKNNNRYVEKYVI